MFEISSWNIQQSALWVVLKIKNTLMSLLLDDLMEQKFTFAKFNQLILSSIWFIFSESMSTWIKCWFVIFSILKVPWYILRCQLQNALLYSSKIMHVSDKWSNRKLQKFFKTENLCWIELNWIQCDIKWKSIR